MAPFGAGVSFLDGRELVDADEKRIPLWPTEQEEVMRMMYERDCSTNLLNEVGKPMEEWITGSITFEAATFAFLTAMRLPSVMRLAPIDHQAAVGH
jgi:hypothetical protein